jgi:glycosyltransferase involved in cell wall biosynthesis
MNASAAELCMTGEGLRTSIVVISDRIEHGGPEKGRPYDSPIEVPASSDPSPSVIGGYLERLPLAAVQSGLVEFAEIWHHSTSSGYHEKDGTHLSRRAFPLTDTAAPFHSQAMIEFVHRHGAPRILCVWGLGVSEAVLDACRDSIVIYNSIDAPALRVPTTVSRHFDIVLTGAQWQSDIVESVHPDLLTAIMPIGPEFASPETFFPTQDAKKYDIIYVAAAQAYKRHDVLFHAMARAPRRLNALCVMGYGEDATALCHQAHDLGIAVDFIEPPGVPYTEVNRRMNQARVGVVCGVNDGAPAILTEYMLAGLPVVANAELACGLHYILPETGIAAPADRFEHAIIEAIDHPERFSPRESVMARWTWPHTVERLKRLLTQFGDQTRIDTAHAQGAWLEPAASA